jgi:CheY-like chemotaxis protein
MNDIPQKQPLRVLIADDNEAITRTFGWMLEALGHQVRAAHSGEEAVALAREFLPEVLLLDISLPGLSGHEVCRILRVEPEFEDSLFIAQTGWSQPEHIERSKQAGFHHHLVKPVTMERLNEILSSLTKRAAA